jgi:hypothetical protein
MPSAAYAIFALGRQAASTPENLFIGVRQAMAVFGCGSSPF